VGQSFRCGSRRVAGANGRDRLGFFGLAPIGSDLGLHIGQNIMSWGIDQRRATEHDQASTAAYISGLQDYGWNGAVD
jgi:hypothetical protein